MTANRNKMLFATPVMLAVLAAIPVSGFAEQELEFTYSDEWSVVSAPPPSGPYRAVHVDPRVPGQGLIPPVTSSFEVADPATPSPDVPPGNIDSSSATTPATQPLGTESVDARDQAATGMAVAVPMNEESMVIEPPVPAAAVAPVDAVKPAPVVEVPAREMKLVAPMLPPAVPRQYAPGLPAVAGHKPDMPAAPAVPDNAMPPPAAGAPGAAMMPPATGRPDAAEGFGRMMPRPPAYNYPGRNWQPGWGMPGYGNMPPYGYYRGPADGMGIEVPPPGRYVPPQNYGGSYPGR